MMEDKIIRNNVVASEKQNFGLTEDQFNEYLKCLDAGDEILLHHVAKHHFSYCITFLMKKFSIQESLAYDYCLDAMLIFRSKLLNKKIYYGNLSFLYTRMASNICVDAHKKKVKLEEAIAAVKGSEFEENEGSNNLLDKLAEIMKGLDEDNTSLLKQIYFDDVPGEKIAEKLGISYSALRKRKQRLLDKLKGLISDKS